MLFVWYFFIVCFCCFYSSYQLTGKSTEDVSNRLHGVRSICVWGYAPDKQEHCGFIVAFFFSLLVCFPWKCGLGFFWWWWIFLIVVWVWGSFCLFFVFNINLHLSAYIPKVCKDGCLCLRYSGMA